MQRWDFLNYLIERYELSSYLEIGCYHDWCFKAIDCRDKIGVDPTCGGTHRMTSDTFFLSTGQLFDLIFIDGLHTQEQSMRDVTNGLTHLTPKGIIVMHDCLPAHEYEQTPTMTNQSSWMGEVWKTFVTVRSWQHVDAAVYNTDCGLGVIIPRPNTDHIELPENLTWGRYQQHRQQWLRICALPEIQKFLP